ncbi:MAG: MmcQ/YjbR family DNA-binding protein [Gemmataceae bacterium]|nr:MmcQ/YjbR family DNA-binding protein [Gemmataceae bacterium]
MTAGEFRKWALGHPEAFEGSHQQHPDFRVGKKIFASLGPDETWAMVRLSLVDQIVFVNEDIVAHKPATGAWGRSGCTIIQLAIADKTLVKKAIQLAWENCVPKKLLKDSGRD